MILTSGDAVTFETFGDVAKMGVHILDNLLSKGVICADDLKKAKGIVFINHSDKGIGIATIKKGSMFIITQLESQLGKPTRWSAPIFFTSVGSGLGFSLGSAVTDAITLLFNRRAVEHFFGSSWDVDINTTSHGEQYLGERSPQAPGAGPVQPGGAVAGIASVTTGADASESDPVFAPSRSESYSVAQGKIKDFTLSGEFFKLSRKTQRMLYGSDPDTRAVLTKGDPPAPAELAPLTDRLTSLAGPVTRANTASCWAVSTGTEMLSVTP